MLGIKTVVNDGKTDIRWINETETVVKMIASLAITAAVKSLSRFEDFETIEDSDRKFVMKGKTTGYEFSVEIVEVGA